MRKRKSKARKRRVLKAAIQVEQLPPLVPRGLAADFALVTTRTLLRAEKSGHLDPIKRNQRTVSYRKDQLDT